MAKVSLYHATYTKEGDESSSRSYLAGSNDDNMLVLDVTDLSDLERSNLQKEYENFLSGQKTFKAYLEEKGINSNLLKWRSFKRSGLSDVTEG